MKIAVILGLFVAATTVFANEKINLEDIERDNLRAESKSETKSIIVDDTSSYGRPGKLEKFEQKYRPQGPRQYEGVKVISGYGGRQQFHDKYVVRPTDYEPDVKYLGNSVDYDKSPDPIRYVVYQQQVETSLPKSQASAYETPRQQLYFQPEIDDRYRPPQQITADKNSNKEHLYVNIPMAQFLAYYPNIRVDEASIPKSHLHLQRPAGQLDQQLAIPIYMGHLNRDAIISNSKIAYQIRPQYASPDPSRYPLLTEAILPTRPPGKFIHTEGLLDHGLPQAQQHYLQAIVYSQQPDVLTYVPTAPSSHDTPSSYDRPSSAHLDTNSLGQNYASQTRQEQTYTPYEHQSDIKYATIPDNQIYQQQNVEHVQPEYENIPEAPGGELDLPRLPAQNFKSSGAVRQSHKPTKGHKGPHCTQNLLVQTSEPRSLLESYIPSHVLAAQNSERYRERPIRLERGFVPSKINYVRLYKKRENE